MDLEDDERILPKTKIPMLFKLVDENKEAFIASLKEVVSIPSISKDPDYANDVIKMLKLCAEQLEDFGAKVDVIDGNSSGDQDGDRNFPPVLFANLFVDDEYKTVCVYGNIDTLAPKTIEKNKHLDFQLREEQGRLYGCGVSDNKTPLICWFNALKIYKQSKLEIPVNIKFVIEGTSEFYSQSLANAIKKNRNFFNNVEYICLTVDKKVHDKPCLKYGYRGLCNFSLMVSCGEKRVHSGTFGGAFNQPLMDAIHIVGSLIDKRGKILLTEFLKDVKPVTEVDIQLCEKQLDSIDFLKQETGVTSLSHKEQPSRLIIHKTRLPSLTVNVFNIKSESADKDDCASIPNKIEAQFSVRLVPNQTVNKTLLQFEKYIHKMWHHFKSANTYELKMLMGFNPWQEDPFSEHYKAAAAAIKTVYKVSPNYISEGSTMPVVSIFGTFCPASNIIVMPLSGSNDQHHSSSESISTNDYIQGIKLAIAYMCEIHELSFK